MAPPLRHPGQRRSHGHRAGTARAGHPCRLVSIGGRPGEAVVSPALARDLPTGRALGRWSAPCASPVVSPTVYLVYMRLTPDQLADAGSFRENRLVYPPVVSVTVCRSLVSRTRSDVAGRDGHWSVVFLVLPALAPDFSLSMASAPEARRRHWHTLKRLGMSRSDTVDSNWPAQPRLHDARARSPVWHSHWRRSFRNTPVPLTGFRTRRP